MAKSEKTLVAFLAGVAAGAVAGLLLAPSDGDTTRARLSDQADRLMDDLENQWEAGYAKIRDITNEAMAEAENYKNKAKSEYEERTS